MSEITMVEIVAANYGLTETGITPPYPPPTKATTALLLIDIQEIATPEYMAAKAVKAGLPEDQVNAAIADYRERFYSAVDKCSELLEAARQNGIPPIHVKIQAKTADGRDTAMVHRMLGWRFPPGSPGTAWVPKTAPKDGEMVLTKAVSSCFNGTNLDQYLRYMGIQYLVIGGFVTDECVETTFRDALDLSYMPFVVRDATTTYFAEAHAHFISKMMGFGLAPAAEEIVPMFAALPDK
jgi:nicotinamidase-related amidase